MSGISDHEREAQEVRAKRLREKIDHLTKGQPDHSAVPSLKEQIEERAAELDAPPGPEAGRE